MSEYGCFNTVIKDREMLVKTLEEIYGVGNVEVHEKPVDLISYNGHTRTLNGKKVQANVIVRRQHVGRSSNDLGWIWDEASGTYKNYVSDYDQGTNFESAKVEAVLEKYAVRVVKAQYPVELGYKFESINNNEDEIEFVIVQQGGFGNAGRGY